MVLGFDRWPWAARYRPTTVRLRVRGVVAYPGLCATRADAPRWSMQLTLASWSVVNGWPQDGPLHITGEADDADLRSLQARCPEGAVVVADVMLEASTIANATLVGLVDTA